METNEKYISIPPYLSTSWRNVRSLHMKGEILVITLIDGDSVEVPQLKPSTIEKIFMCHANFLHYQGSRSSVEGVRKELPHGHKAIDGHNQPFMSTLRFNLGGMEGMNGALQHDQTQANTPDLPEEILQKIAAVAKIVVPEDINAIPKAEPHCNCVHCQVSRAIHKELQKEEKQEQQQNPKELEEVITQQDLSFREWDITKTGENLYAVANPLDQQERYNVFLGNPIGCTCGSPNCQHIVAVLKS